VNLVLPHLKRLYRSCLAMLSSRFALCTKPLTSSLLLGSLADLGRSKSQLIAENALLRQQLIILSWQVKRQACTKADRTLLVLLARLVRTWQQGPFHCSTGHTAAVASGDLSPGLETQVKGRFASAEDRCRNHRLDQGDGSEKSTVGC
jgi:hypothetical protein